MRRTRTTVTTQIMEGAGASSPDIIPSVISLLHGHVLATQHDTSEAMRVLRGIGKAKGLSLALMMLPQAQAAQLRSVVAQAEAEGFDAAAVATVKQAFNL
jgi:hypothetical protein